MESETTHENSEPADIADIDSVPFGLAVASKSGRLLALNSTAAAILGVEGDADAITRAEARTCCELICGLVEGGADFCLTKRASAHDGALPEIRVDLDGRQEHPVQACWVLAESTHEGRRVAYMLRPGHSGDRRRRTRPYWVHGKRISVHSLGTTRIEAGETTLDGEWLGNRPGRVFKYLLCRRPDIVQPDEIAEALRSNAESNGTGSIRYHVHALRAALEPDRKPREPSAFILARSGGYTLADGRIWVDVDEFEDLVEAGSNAQAGGNSELATIEFERATALYNGEFLTDELYADWAAEERERLRALAGAAFNALVGLRLEAGDDELASEHARRLAELEPFDNRAQRQSIELCLRRGRRSEASRRYDTFRRRLDRDFGDSPNFSLTDLIDDASAQ